MTNSMATMVNPGMLPPLQVKDSRWLTLEVCREFTRNKCTRSETECKFAHPPPHVEVQNGRVTCCFDSIKGKCQRKDPPCKYLHPPQHLREQLLQNGRNNLILKNLQMQAMAAGLQPMVHGIIPPTDKYRGVSYSANYQDPQGQLIQAGSGKALSYQHAALHPAGQYPVVQGNPYLTMQSGTIFNPYLGQTVPQMASVMPSIDASGNAAQVQGMIQQQTGSQQKMQRADRLEPTTTTGSSGTDSWTGSYVDSIAPTSQYSPVYFQPQVVEVLTAAGKKRPRDPGDDFITLGMSMPTGMVPMVKRPAVADSKSGIPMYQPGTGTTAYQQAALAAMQLQQPFVPVTMSLIPNAQAAVTAAAAGALVSNATNVSYFDEANQLLDTLPVCRDFKSGQCKRPQCKYVHLVEDYVEVTDGKVTVCRDAAKGRCTRPMCKYYHIPMVPQLLV